MDSVFVHKMWNDKELVELLDKDVPYPMASDQKGEVSKDYLVYDDDSGTCIRGSFIIDPDGIVQTAEVLTPPVGRNIDELIRQIKAAQEVRKSNGTQAMPAGWDTGKKALTPSEDLVGNVWKEIKENK